MLPGSECLVWGGIDNPKPELPAVLDPVSLAHGVSSGSICYGGDFGNAKRG